MTVFLVRHGRLLGDELDPAGFDDVWALRDRLPQGALWFCAPEPGAVATCQLLTEADAGILPGLRDVGPEESTEAFRERVAGAVAGLRREHPGRDLVLIGHHAAWLALAGAVAEPLGTPGVIELPDALGSAG